MQTEEPPAERELDEQRLLELTRSVAAELRSGERLDSGLGLDSSLDADFGLESLARAELIRRIESALGLELPDTLLSSAETPRDLLYAVSRARRVTAAPSEEPIRAVREVEGFEAADSLIDVLRTHLERRPDQLHIRLLGEEGEEEITYRDLDIGARRVASGLLQAGVKRGETIALMLPTGSDYFFTFFGVMGAGCIPVPIYPPARPTQIEDHLTRHAAILRNAGTTMLITVAEASRVAQILKHHVPSLRTITSPEDLSSRGELGSLESRASSDIAFLQYTSGSTGNPKGVVLTHANVLANLRAVGKVIDIQRDDLVVSWLPLYHDMGLIGTWLGSFYYAMPLVSISPLRFLTRPSRWLRVIERFRGTISAAPNFAYEMCTTKVPDDEIEGLDLSSWRLAFNGAEAVSAETIRRFTDRYGSRGFAAESMMPVYGLAECALALAFPPRGRAPVVESVDRDRLTRDGVVVPTDEPDSLRFVGCGHTLPGHEIRIVDSRDRELPDRHEGRVQFRGPSATSGYFDNEPETRRLRHGDWLDSGDVGYLSRGEVFITGRAKDLIIRAGRHIHPEEIEEAVGSIEGIRKGCVAVFGTRDQASQTERVIIVAETREESAERRASLQSRVGTTVLDVSGTTPDEVVLAPPHSVLKTSSGKVRRSATREAYESGTLGKTAAPWMQVARLELSSLRSLLPRTRRSLREFMYAAYALSVAAFAAPFIWISVVGAPGLARRRRLLKRELRAILRLLRIPVSASGEEEIPGTPCIFAVNHSSYFDGVVVSAVLPPNVTFVVMEELSRRFTSRIFFSRIGSVFVSRAAREGGVDTAGELDAVTRRGESLVVFPEARLSRMGGLLPFRMGAFLASARSGLPVVPVTLRGTRAILRGDERFFRRGRVDVVIGEPVEPQNEEWSAAVDLRKRIRAIILEESGEPDLEA